MKPLKVRNEGLWREMGIRSRNVTGKLARANRHADVVTLAEAGYTKAGDPEQLPHVQRVPLRNVAPLVAAMLGIASVGLKSPLDD